jgi:hypothetical protein
MKRGAFALRPRNYLAARGAASLAFPGADPVRAAILRRRLALGADHARFAVTPTIRARA